MKLFGAVLGLFFGFGLRQFVMSMPLMNWRSVQVTCANALRVAPEQLSWMVIGGTAGGVVLGWGRSFAAVICATVAGGALARFLYREHTARVRNQRAIAQSLLTPSFLDMLAISMATGVGLRSSLTALVPKAPAVIQELWRGVTDTPEKSLVDQLQEISQDCKHSPTQRVANALIVSTERGTPIVDVLHNLAQEIRAESRRQLLEIAAKKDVQMMLPVVFGILPSITAIALFPAVGSLTSLT